MKKFKKILLSLALLALTVTGVTTPLQAQEIKYGQEIELIWSSHPSRYIWRGNSINEVTAIQPGLKDHFCVFILLPPSGKSLTDINPATGTTYQGTPIPNDGYFRLKSKATGKMVEYPSAGTTLRLGSNTTSEFRVHVYNPTNAQGYWTENDPQNTFQITGNYFVYFANDVARTANAQTAFAQQPPPYFQAKILAQASSAPAPAPEPDPIPTNAVTYGDEVRLEFDIAPGVALSASDADEAFGSPNKYTNDLWIVMPPGGAALTATNPDTGSPYQGGVIDYAKKIQLKHKNTGKILALGGNLKTTTNSAGMGQDIVVRSENAGIWHNDDRVTLNINQTMFSPSYPTYVRLPGSTFNNEWGQQYHVNCVAGAEITSTIPNQYVKVVAANLTNPPSAPAPTPTPGAVYGNVWGIAADNKVYFREGINDANPTGTSWSEITGLAASDISVGPDGAVWALGNTPVGGGYKIYFREGITGTNPKGTSWSEVGGAVVVIATGLGGQAWGVNDGDNLFFRQGITQSQPKGTAWQHVNPYFKYVDAGSDTYNSVWATGSYPGVVYRHWGNTITQPGPTWSPVESYEIKQIAVGPNGQPWGINASNEVVARTGITGQQKDVKGTSWQACATAAKFVGVTRSNQVWMVKNDNSIWVSETADMNNMAWQQISGQLIKVTGGGMPAGYVPSATPPPQPAPFDPTKHTHNPPAGTTFNDAWQLPEPNRGLIKFQAKGNDIYVDLSQLKAAQNNQTYRSIIGGWSNTQSAIQRLGGIEQLAAVGTDSTTNFHDYWMSIDGGLIKIGKGTEYDQNKFIELNDPSTIANIIYVGFGGWDLAVEFQNISIQPLPTAPTPAPVPTNPTDNVWAVSGSDGKVWFREGVTATNPEGTSWTEITGLQARWINVSASGEVWAIESAGPAAPYYRTGITTQNPKGDGWVKFDGGNIMQIGAGLEGQLWCKTYLGELFYRTGITEQNPIGNGWTKVTDGNVSAYRFAVGANGSVWATDSNQVAGTGFRLVYRTGIDANNPGGTGWQTVTDGFNVAADLAIGPDGQLWATNNVAQASCRLGITTSNPFGTTWSNYFTSSAAFMAVSPTNNLWFINTSKQIFIAKDPTPGAPSFTGVGGTPSPLTVISAGGYPGTIGTTPAPAPEPTPPAPTPEPTPADAVKYGQEIRLVWSFFPTEEVALSGSDEDIVFGSTAKTTNELWTILPPSGSNLNDTNPATGSPYQGSPITQGDIIRLQHKNTGNILRLDQPTQAPSLVTGGENIMIAFSDQQNGQTVNAGTGSPWREPYDSVFFYTTSGHFLHFTGTKFTNQLGEQYTVGWVHINDMTTSPAFKIAMTTLADPTSAPTPPSATEPMPAPTGMEDNVWCITSSNDIFFREGITTSNPKGTGWSQITGLKAAELALSPEGAVWAINLNDQIFFRTGITQENPKGTGWTQVSGLLNKIALGPNGQLWGRNSANAPFIRTGITQAAPMGTAWENIVPSTEGLVDIAVGANGTVFSLGLGNVDVNGKEIKYRTGVTSSDFKGTAWQTIAGSLNEIVVGPSGQAWGKNATGTVFGRTGVTSTNQIGTGWQNCGTNTNSVAVSVNNHFWATKTDQSIVFSSTADVNNMAWEPAEGLATKIYAGGRPPVPVPTKFEASFNILDAWYGVEGKTNPNVKGTLDQQLTADKYLNIPADMTTYFGSDPHPGEGKQLGYTLGCTNSLNPTNTVNRYTFHLRSPNGIASHLAELQAIDVNEAVVPDVDPTTKILPEGFPAMLVPMQMQIVGATYPTPSDDVSAQVKQNLVDNGFLYMPDIQAALGPANDPAMDQLKIFIRMKNPSNPTQNIIAVAVFDADKPMLFYPIDPANTSSFLELPAPGLQNQVIDANGTKWALTIDDHPQFAGQKELYYQPTGSTKWTKIDAAAKDIAAHPDKLGLWVVGVNGAIFSRDNLNQQPDGTGWSQVPGKSALEIDARDYLDQTHYSIMGDDNVGYFSLTDNPADPQWISIDYFTILQDQIQTLMDEITQLQNDLKNEQDALGTCNTSITTLQDQIKTLQDQLTQAQDDLKIALDNEQNAKDQLDGINQNITNLTNQKNQLEQDITDLNNQIGPLQDQITQLKNFNNQNEQTAKDNDNYINGLQDQLKQFTDQRDQLQNQLNKITSELPTAQQEQKTAEDALKQAQDQLKQAQDDITSLTTQINTIQQELNTLLTQQPQLDQQVNNLTNELNQKQQDLTTLHQDLINARNTVAQLGFDLGTAQKQESDANEEIAQLQPQLTDAQNQVTTLTKQLTDAQNNQKSAADQIAVIQPQLDAALKQVSDLQAELTSALAAKKEAEDEVTRLTNELAKAQGDLTDIQNQLNTIDSDIADKNTEIANLQAQLQNLQSSINTNQQHITEATSDLKEANNNITLLNNALNTCNVNEKDLNDQITKLTQDLTKAQQDAQQTQNDLTKAQQDLTNAKNDITSLEDQLTNTLSQQKQKGDELGDLGQQLTDKQQELSDKQTELNQTTKAKQDADAEIITLTGDLNQAKQKNRDLNDEIKQLTDDISQTQQDIDQNQSNLDTALTDLNNANNEIAKLTDELNKLQAEQPLSDDPEINRLQQDLSQALADKQAAENEINRLNNAITKAQGEISQLQKDLADAQSGEQTVGSEIDKLNQDIADAQSELTKLQQQLTNEQDQVQTCETDVDTLDTQIKDLQNQLLSAQNEVNSLTQQISNAQKNQQQIQGNRDQLEKDLTDAQADIDRLTNELTAANNELTKVTGERDKIQNDLTSEQSEVTRLTNELTAAQQALDAAVNNQETELQTSLNNALNDKQQLETARDKLSQDIASAQQQIQKLNGQITTAQTTGGDVTTQVQNLTKQIQDINTDITNAQEQINNLTQEVTNLENLVTQTTTERDNALNELTQLQTQLNQLTKERDDANNERQRLENEIAALQQNLGGGSTEAAQLLADIGQLQTQIEQLNTDIKTATDAELLAQNELTSIQTEITNTTTRINDITVERDQLEQDLITLQTEADTLTNNLQACNLETQQLQSDLAAAGQEPAEPARTRQPTQQQRSGPRATRDTRDRAVGTGAVATGRQRTTAKGIRATTGIGLSTEGMVLRGEQQDQPATQQPTEQAVTRQVQDPTTTTSTRRSRTRTQATTTATPRTDLSVAAPTRTGGRATGTRSQTQTRTVSRRR
ncbi:MAG: hypothetical protein H6679_05170 [Epsilonproteobacteria bacterium]|nr:hypothetical protein [Campylobacterota bacterium]